MSKLCIIRESSFVGCVVPFRIFINKNEIGKVSNGESINIDAPNENFNLKFVAVGAAITFHPVYADILIEPSKSNSGQIKCHLQTTLNVLGAITGGFVTRVGNLKIDVDYGS